MKPLRWELFSRIKRRLITRCALAGTLAVTGMGTALPVRAQDPVPNFASSTEVAPPAVPFLETTPQSAGTCFDPIAPCWVPPVCRVPNFFGDYFGVGIRATGAPPSTLSYTGFGVEGGGFEDLVSPLLVNGPGGPFVLNNNIETPDNNDFPLFDLEENPELTALVRAQFPTATFIEGGGEYLTFEFAAFFYDYLLSSGLTAAVNLPNPSGGGLVGRNRYFENGSPIPRDRVFFTYNHVGGYRGLNVPFDVNRYVLGGEKTFWNGMASLEMRVPFAGTASSDQFANSPGTVTATEFGNIGLLLKGLFISTPTFMASVGLGVSLPTAESARVMMGNTPFIVTQNRTTLIQPIIGCAWAPNDRFYAQSGLQFDLDPYGNPVSAANGFGGMSRIGNLNDQKYAYFDNAVGYWLYSNQGSETLTGVALQSELHYYNSFGGADSVSNGLLTVTDVNSGLNVLNGTTGMIFRFAERANLAVGVSYPLGGDRYYDWSLQTQLNYQFGR